MLPVSKSHQSLQASQKFDEAKSLSAESHSNIPNAEETKDGPV
jgi:hypothetical protein